MIRKYAQNLLSRVKRSEKSVLELWLPKSPTFSGVLMNRYQFAVPLPIRWTPSAEPPSKMPKRGPGRPR